MNMKEFNWGLRANYEGHLHYVTRTFGLGMENPYMLGQGHLFGKVTCISAIPPRWYGEIRDGKLVNGIGTDTDKEKIMRKIEESISMRMMKLKKEK